MSTVPQEIDALEAARRLSGLKFTTISEQTGIPYKRLWRFFRGDGSLSRAEIVRLEGVLPLKVEAEA